MVQGALVEVEVAGEGGEGVRPLCWSQGSSSQAMGRVGGQMPHLHLVVERGECLQLVARAQP